MWLKTFYENPKGLFMGLYQKGGRRDHRKLARLGI